MSHRHWLKFGVRSAHFTSSHESSSCAHVVCLILRDSPFLFLLSTFPPIVSFILLVASFFFTRCGGQIPCAHSLMRTLAPLPSTTLSHIFTWKLWMGKDELGHKSGGQHTSNELQSRKNRRWTFPWLDSQMVKLRNFKDNDENSFPRFMDAHEVLNSSASASASATASRVAGIECKEQEDFYLGYDGGYMIPIHSKIGQGMRIHVDKFVCESVWKERVYSSLSREWYSQFLPEPGSEVWRNVQCESDRSAFWERESTVGIRVWQSSALVSPTATLSRDAVPIGDDIETVGESRADVEMRNEEDEEPSEAEILRVTMNPKNPTSREKQEHEDSRHAVCRSWCAARVEGRGVVDNIELNFWKKRKVKGGPQSQLSITVFWQENADTFPILICRDGRYGQTGATCCERKGPTAYSISFLVGFIKDLGFRRIILKCDNEPSTKALQEAVIHACVGVEVIPQGPPEGDHMANGRVEMAVREVKRQCRTLPISAEHNTGVRIADDSPLPSWLSRFAAQVMNKMRIGKDGKTCEMRRSGRRWRKPMGQFGEKVWFLGEDGVSSFASRMTQGILCGTPWQMVAPELKLTKKVTSDKGGAGTPIAKDCVWKSARSWTQKIPRVVRRSSWTH